MVTEQSMKVFTSRGKGKKIHNKLNSSYGSDRSIGQFYSSGNWWIIASSVFPLNSFDCAQPPFDTLSISHSRHSFHRQMLNVDDGEHVSLCWRLNFNFFDFRLNLITRSKPF